MRWAQLAFIEDDPTNYDPNFWLDYFRRIHADAACLSAGGCVAFYPTRVPLHYRSRWLKNTDPFKEMLEGCRKLTRTAGEMVRPGSDFPRDASAKLHFGRIAGVCCVRSAILKVSSCRDFH